MTGTIIAQVIPIALTPLLTRLYSPDQFGIYGFISSTLAITSIVATARYENAVFIPKNSKLVDAIIYLSLCLATFFSLLLTIFVFIENNWLLEILKLKEIQILYFIPLGTLIVSYYNVLRIWLNKIEAYRQIRKNIILQSAAVGLAQIFSGLSKNLMSYGLIAGEFAGKLLTTLTIFMCFYKSSSRLKLNRILFVIKRFGAIPKYQMPAALANNLALHAPYLVLPMIFSQTITGYYFLVFRIVMMPIGIIGNSILEVFRVEASKSIRVRGECSKCFMDNFYALALIALLIYVILQFGGISIFKIFFGEKWAVAGKYAQILAPFAAIRLVAAPLSYLFILRERHRLNFIFQMLFFGTVLIALYMGYTYKKSELFVCFISYLGGLFYLLQLWMAYRMAQ